jgi:hypothetical protein
MYPLGKGIQSSYHRHFDTAEKCWQQQGVHVLHAGLFSLEVRTLAIIDITSNNIRVTMSTENNRWEATLQDVGQVEDEGIPSWHVDTQQ